MARKIKDLSPRMNIPVAEVELALPADVTPMAERVGGLSTYSNSFKRGSGDNVFGSDENGIWLGAADYADAPFKVGMDGQVLIRNADSSSSLDADTLIFYNDDVPAIVIGNPS